MIFQNTDTQKQCDPISSKFYHFCSFEPGINQFSVTVWPGSTSVTDSYIIYILNYPFCHSWLIPSVPYMGMGGNYLYPLFYLFAYAFCSLRFFRIKFPIAILVISNFQILNAPFRLPSNSFKILAPKIEDAVAAFSRSGRDKKLPNLSNNISSPSVVKRIAQMRSLSMNLLLVVCVVATFDIVLASLSRHNESISMKLTDENILRNERFRRLFELENQGRLFDLLFLKLKRLILKRQRVAMKSSF